MNGAPATLSWTGCFLSVKTEETGADIQLEYGLPVETITEVTDGVEYRIKWRGDDVLGIAPNTDFLPFYRDLHEPTRSQ